MIAAGAFPTGKLLGWYGLVSIGLTKLTSGFKENLELTRLSPGHGYWVPFGFGFGAITATDPDSGLQIAIPAMALPTGGHQPLINVDQELSNLFNHAAGYSQDL